MSTDGACYARPSSFDGTDNDTLRRDATTPEDQIGGIGPKSGGVRLERIDTREALLSSGDLRGVTAPTTSKGVEFLKGEIPEADESAESGGEVRDGGVHADERSHRERLFVKPHDDPVLEVDEDLAVSGKKKATSQPSPIAQRIRARLAELEQTESSYATGLEKHRTLLSKQLERLDEGGNLRSDTLLKLEKRLGKSVQWILTGEEPAGFMLASFPGWKEAADAAVERYRLSPELVEVVGRFHVPAKPARIDAAIIATLARMWIDAT